MMRRQIDNVVVTTHFEKKIYSQWSSMLSGCETKKIFQTPVATIKNLPPHHYPEPTLYTKEHTPPVCKTSVKIKSTRSYDPSAIARLKEKLGISVNKEPVD